MGARHQSHAIPARASIALCFVLFLDLNVRPADYLGSIVPVLGLASRGKQSNRVLPGLFSSFM